MKRTAIVNLTKLKWINTLSNNKLLISMALVYVFGIFIGTLFLKNSSAVLNVATLNFEEYLDIRLSRGFFDIFLNSFISALPVALIIFLCGTSLIGIALTFFSLTYCGITYGITSAFLYSNYALIGIAYNSLILIPCTVLTALGFLLSGKEAFIFSLRLAKLTMPKGQTANVYSDFKNYCIKFALIVFIFIGSAILDAVLTKSFIGYFNFWH